MALCCKLIIEPVELGGAVWFQQVRQLIRNTALRLRRRGGLVHVLGALLRPVSLLLAHKTRLVFLSLGPARLEQLGALGNGVAGPSVVVALVPGCEPDDEVDLMCLHAAHKLAQVDELLGDASGQRAADPGRVATLRHGLGARPLLGAHHVRRSLLAHSRHC